MPRRANGSPAPPCKVCEENPARAHGLCMTCYQRARRAEMTNLRAGLRANEFGAGPDSTVKISTLLAGLDELNAILRTRSVRTVTPMEGGRFMEIFRTDEEEVWMRYTFRVTDENNPFIKK